MGLVARNLGLCLVCVSAVFCVWHDDGNAVCGVVQCAEHG